MLEVTGVDAFEESVELSAFGDVFPEENFAGSDELVISRLSSYNSKSSLSEERENERRLCLKRNSDPCSPSVNSNVENTATVQCNYFAKDPPARMLTVKALDMSRARGHRGANTSVKTQRTLVKDTSLGRRLLSQGAHTATESFCQ